MPKLASAYALWKKSTSSRSNESTPTASFTLEVLDVFSLKTEATIPIPDDIEERVEALVLNGYLSNVPQRPSLAFSFKTLELFRILRLVKPSFSAEAFVKLICYFYVVCCIICVLLAFGV